MVIKWEPWAVTLAFQVPFDRRRGNGWSQKGREREKLFFAPGYDDSGSENGEQRYSLDVAGAKTDFWGCRRIAVIQLSRGEGEGGEF